MNLDEAIRWVHLVAAATWVGGLITLAVLVPALRGAGATTEMLRAMARRFGVLSWVAIGAAALSGVAQLDRLDVSLSEDSAYAGRLFVKLVLVGGAATLALFHQMTARRSSAAARGVVQALILLSSLAVVAAAVRL